MYKIRIFYTVGKRTYVSYSGENTWKLLNMSMKSNWEKNCKQGRKFRIPAICELSKLFNLDKSHLQCGSGQG